MRVVMILLDYHPVTGGAQRQVATLAPRLAAAGVEIEVWTRAVAGRPAAEEVAGVPVRRLGGVGPGAALRFAVAACARLTLARPDVVHAFSLFSPAAVALFGRRALGIPAVVKVLRGGPVGDLARLLRKPFGARRAAALVRHLDRFVAISTEIDAELAGLGLPPERRVRLPNGVDTERFRPATPAERAALRARLGLPAGPLVAIACRLVPEKRVEALLAAWPAVRAAQPGATLAVVGDGPCRAALRRAAAPGVHFAGDVDDVAPWLRAADVFALPSRGEGLSNAMLEAMACALPVVATPVGGARDLLEDGVSGRLVAEPEPDALAAALGSLLGEPAQRRRLGEAARRRVVADYALPHVADALVRLYAGLAPARRRSRAATAARPFACPGATHEQSSGRR